MDPALPHNLGPSDSGSDLFRLALEAAPTGMLMIDRTGNIMLVLRSGETDRQMAEAKLKLLDRLPIRILGAVLNDIRSADSAYKHYRYVYGYTADEEPTPQLAGPTAN